MMTLKVLMLLMMDRVIRMMIPVTILRMSMIAINCQDWWLPPLLPHAGGSQSGQVHEKI